MSTKIVSSKEGHDESHIDDTKIRTYFKNDVNVVTTRLTQKYWHIDCFDCKGKILQLPFEHRAAWQKTWQDDYTRQKHSATVDNAFFWKTQMSDMTHESGSSQRSAEYPIDWHDMQTSAMFKGNNKLPFICKMIPFPFSPSWLMSATFHFYEFK